MLALGDLAYPTGTADQFKHCYDPVWGSFKNRTYPVPGNHEYMTAGAAGYFEYFGAAAGDPTKGYYSYDLGSWHIVALNSNCDPIGGCDAGSPQEQWLQADLAAHPNACTLAYMHFPLYSSGRMATIRTCGRSGRICTTSMPSLSWSAMTTTTSDSHRKTRTGNLTRTGESGSSWWAPGERANYDLGAPRPNSEFAMTPPSACSS